MNINGTTYSKDISLYSSRWLLIRSMPRVCNLMRSIAGKRKRLSTSGIVERCTVLFAFLLLLNGTAAHEEQIPEPMTSPVVVENHETNRTQVDVDKQGDSTFPPEKAMLDDSSRGTNVHDVEFLDGPNDSERNGKNVPGEANKQDVALSADFPAADAMEALQQQKEPPLGDYAETRGDHAYAYTPYSDAATHPDGDIGAPHPEIEASTRCEGKSEDEKEAGGSVLVSTARHESSERANGSSVMEQKGNGRGETNGSQQGEMVGGEEQGQREEERNGGIGGSELSQTPVSPFTAGFDQIEQPVCLTVAVGDQAISRDTGAGAGHVQGSIGVDEEDRGAANTISGPSHFGAHKRSGGPPDETQVPGTIISVAAKETTASAHIDPEDPLEHLQVEDENRSNRITGDASSVTDARPTPPVGSSDDNSPSDSGGGGVPVAGYPYYGAPRRDRSTALRDSNEDRTGVEVESPRRRGTPAETIGNRGSYLNRADDVEGTRTGRWRDRGRGGDSGGISAGGGVEFKRGSPEELAQRVKHVEAELARKLLAEEDAKSLLDIWVEKAREFVLTRTVPPTDAECDFNWSRLRCEPKCLCGSRLRFGDYTPGRSCRLLHPWEHSSDCEDAWDPSDEPALRRLGAATKRALGSVKRAYDARVAPATDADCTFDLETRRCQPQPACRFRFRWGDISLSNACRLV